MYRDYGRLGCVNIRSISYVEDRQMDRSQGYRYGFDIELLPSVRISSHWSRISIIMRWLCWEIIWFKYYKYE